MPLRDKQYVSILNSKQASQMNRMADLNTLRALDFLNDEIMLRLNDNEVSLWPMETCRPPLWPRLPSNRAGDPNPKPFYKAGDQNDFKI
jgi:hypothetical protein